MQKEMVQFMVSEDMQDGAGSCYQGPQLPGAESRVLMLGLEWLAHRGNRNRGQDTWKNNPGCSGSIEGHLINLCHKSLSFLSYLALGRTAKVQKPEKVQV